MDHRLDVRDCETYWFQGVPFPFYFHLFYFTLLETFSFQGVSLGTLLRSRECVGISGGCASVRNAPDLRNTGTLLIFIVFARSSGLQAPLNIYLLLFCSL